MRVSAEFKQRFAGLRRYAAPLARLALAKQPRTRVPGAVVAAEQPAPVRRMRQQDPDRFSQGAGKMRNARVDGYHEIELRYQRSRVGKISELVSKPQHAAIRQQLRILCPDFLLQAHELGDFSDTAALISQLDLVISVDTSVAHLAGALGKPVWVLLTHAPDWRWLLDRDDSPWYPTARLFRQARPGEWDPVLARVIDAGRSRAIHGWKIGLARVDRY